MGLRVKEMSADGNCAFRAIADQLEGDAGDHASLRARALDFMVANRQEGKRGPGGSVAPCT